MNNKSEFTRCRIPRLTVKFGTKEIRNEEEESELLTEQLVEAAIKKLKQKQRREELRLEEEKPPGKRRRVVKDMRGVKRGRPVDISEDDKICEVSTTNNFETVKNLAVTELKKRTSDPAGLKSGSKIKQTTLNHQTYQKRRIPET